jgi:DnaJ-class molecular chaperone
MSDMALVAGEYVFECLECNGEGSIEVFDVEQDQVVWVTCSDCSGEGVQYLDEEEAAERIDTGYTPLRTPST